MALPWVLFVLVPDIVFALVIVTRPTLALRYLFLIYLAFNAYLASKIPLDNFLQYHVFGSHFGCRILSAWNLVIIKNPLEEVRHELETVRVQDWPLWKRIWWAFPIIIWPRSIGWNIEVRGVPPRPGPSRKAFIVRAFKSVIWHAILVDLAQCWTSPIPMLSNHNASPGSLGYAVRWLNVYRWMVFSYGMLTINYNLLAILSVASRLSQPQFWPDIFGSWGDAYTVRGFWCSTWHQMMRQIATSTGRQAAQALRCKRGSRSSACIRLVVGFMASGLAHVVGDAFAVPKYTGYILLPFVLQPIGIMLEQLAMFWASRWAVKESRWTHLVGYVWTFGWLFASVLGSMAWLLDEKLHIVIAAQRPLSFSVIQYGFGLFKRGVVPSLVTSDRLEL